MRLALAGLMIYVISNSGCAYQGGEVLRELIVAAGEERIYVLNPIDQTLFELGQDEEGIGWYREIKWEPPGDVDYLPMSQLSKEGSMKFYGRSDEGLIEITISPSEEKIGQTTRKLDIGSGENLIAVDGDAITTLTDSGIRIVKSGSDYSIAKPAGTFSQPVTTGKPGGGWYVIWPDAIAEEKTGRGRSWAEFSLSTAGETGMYTVQEISPGGDMIEYRLRNDTYEQTRAKKLIGVLADADGRLYILDDKSYITSYEGEKLITNYFAGFSPSRYAVNSYSRGPEGSLLVTDAVGLMVNMYDMKTGEAVYSWRLPLKKKEFTTRARNITCLVDAILLIIVVVLVWRIMARVRRYQVYRKGDGKR